MPNELNPSYANDLNNSLILGTAVPSGERWVALFTSEWVESTDYTGRIDLTTVFGTGPTDGDSANDSVVVFHFVNGDVITNWAIVDDETADPTTGYLERGTVSPAQTVEAGGTLEIPVGLFTATVDAN